MNASTSASKPYRPVSEAERSLKIGGVTPFTSTDFPGKLAAVVFVQGCPWQCGYCHNPHLQLRLQKSPLQWSKVLALLEKRVGLIDAVVFSGGEPTLDPALPSAIRDVRKLGFEVGLHCGGAYPQRLEEVLPEVDWVALDIKAPFDDYEKVTGVADSGLQALACAKTVLASKVKYEFRTTVHPSLMTDDEIGELARSLSGIGVENYALQVFRSQGCKTKELKAVAMGGYPREDTVAYVASLFSNFSFRPA